MNELEMPGLDGSNPLAFLAALGTLRVLAEAWRGRDVRLSWPKPRMTPDLVSDGPLDPETVVGVLLQQLRAPTFRAAEKISAHQDARADANNAGKRGKRKRSRLGAREVGAIVAEAARSESDWLAEAAPHLLLGQGISVPQERFRAFAIAAQEAATQTERRLSDFAASYGCDSLVQRRREDAVQVTEFCLVHGSGHQHYLETARKLLSEVTPDHVERALFRPFWDYADKRLALRWDPADAREHAYRWLAPEDDPAPTMWAANLLAFEGTSLFPTAPVGGGLCTVGFAGRGEGANLTWPIWESPLGVDAVRGVLALAELGAERPNRDRLARMGIWEIFRARKIKVGRKSEYKWNLSPAQPV